MRQTPSRRRARAADPGAPARPPGVRPAAATYRRPRALTLRLLLWRLRGPAGVLAVAVAALWVVEQLAPTPPRTVPVVVTARDVAAGTRLGAGDVRLVRVPDRLVPDAALSDPAELVDRTTRVPLPAGLPVVEPLLVGTRFAAALPDGAVAVPVRLTTPTATGLLAGDLVDIVAPVGSLGHGGDVEAGADGDGGPEPPVLAQRAIVLDVVGQGDPGGGELTGTASSWSAGTGAAEVVVWLAVSPTEGRRLAATTSGPGLGAVLVG